MTFYVFTALAHARTQQSCCLFLPTVFSHLSEVSLLIVNAHACVFASQHGHGSSSMNIQVGCGTRPLTIIHGATQFDAPHIAGNCTLYAVPTSLEGGRGGLLGLQVHYSDL